MLQHHAALGRQGLLHARRVFWLDTDDLDFGAQLFDVGGDAGDQPTTTDRHENGVRITRMLAQQLHRHRALSGDDQGIVEGMDEHQAFFGGKLQGMFIGLVVAVAVQHGARAIAAHRRDLDLRGGARHDDQRLDPAFAGAQRHALRVIARRSGDHAPRAFLVGQVRNLVVGAANLEREHRLQVFTLHPYRIAQSLTEARRGFQGRLARDFIHARVEDHFQIIVGHRGII